MQFTTAAISRAKRQNNNSKVRTEGNKPNETECWNKKRETKCWRHTAYSSKHNINYNSSSSGSSRAAEESRCEIAPICLLKNLFISYIVYVVCFTLLYPGIGFAAFARVCVRICSAHIASTYTSTHKAYAYTACLFIITTFFWILASLQHCNWCHQSRLPVEIFQKSKLNVFVNWQTDLRVWDFFFVHLIVSMTKSDWLLMNLIFSLYCFV